jgi:hypothetical protein
MIELTHDQSIADLILHGWGARKANHEGRMVYWLAKMETKETKGAWAIWHTGHKPSHTPMKQIMIGCLQGEIEPEVCEWDQMPEELLRLLIDTEPMVLS